MALERQSIEKKDFPIGRRGYEPDAVDTHLGELADEIEELKRSARRRSETLASSASEQVRAIVEAAETSAAEIQRQAEEEAREIRAEAAGEAQSMREQATAQARDYVGRVSESTAVMLQRLDAMESELGGLVESLRTGSNRLSADLQLLEGNLTEVNDAVGPRPRFESEPEVGAPRGARTEDPARSGEQPGREDAESHDEPLSESSFAVRDDESLPEPPRERATASSTTGGPPSEPARASSAAAGRESASLAAEPDTADASEDDEGARLIALNMALNGTPREETDRYLAENFFLPDRAGLLEDVYASVDG